ncbi:MAG: hypothetical protein U9Q73_00420 [Nanoarchaeota archaeon]|nr:hypothetical protein [Nanoarchaeota archaeon]
MGIGETLRSMRGRGTIRDRCDKNQETGEVVCRRTRVHPDKTETEIAGFTMGVDASCNPTSGNMFEHEDGALEALEKKFVPKMIGKCKRDVPADY